MNSEAGFPQFYATGFTGRISWSAVRQSGVETGNGHFIPATSENGETVTFGSRGGVFNVTATDLIGGATAQANGQNLGACFPFQPDYNAGGGGSAVRSVEQNTLASKAEDGGESFVEKGDLIRKFSWKFLKRDMAEWQEVDAFYTYFRKTKPFWLLDAARSPLVAGVGTGVLWRVRITSDWNDDPIDVDLIDYEMAFAQAVRF